MAALPQQQLQRANAFTARTFCDASDCCTIHAAASIHAAMMPGAYDAAAMISPDTRSAIFIAFPASSFHVCVCAAAAAHACVAAQRGSAALQAHTRVCYYYFRMPFSRRARDERHAFIFVFFMFDVQPPPPLVLFLSLFSIFFIRLARQRYHAVRRSLRRFVFQALYIHARQLP
jgi:hypothetical protein